MNHILHRKQTFTRLPATLTFGDTCNIAWIHSISTSSATGGTRQLVFKFYDEGNNLVIDLHPRVTQVKNEILHYELMYGSINETARHDEHIAVCLPLIYVEPNWTLVVTDENAIDLAGDKITLSFQGIS